MSDFPVLQNFFAAYFHQDWAMEHASPDAVVAYFRDGESPEHVQQARAELTALLERHGDEASLEAAVRGLGCEYVPEAGYRPWLLRVERLLAGEPG